MIALEQNYRSTQTILDAANSVIEHNRDRKPKRLWSDLGAGDTVRVVEAEDEHAEARFVAGRIQSALDDGANPSEIAVFYRMNAQSRVLEDLLTRQGIDYRVVGGPQVLRAGRDQGPDRLPAGARQPGRRGVAAADREPAAARHRQHLARPPVAAHARALGVSLWEAIAGRRGGAAGRGRRRAA